MTQARGWYLREMRYVRVGRRFVAIFIDSLVIGAFTAPFVPLADFVHRAGYVHVHVGGHHLFWPGLAAIVYFTVFEGLTGATLGKVVMGIRVVNEDGSKLTWSNSFVRNIARLIDAFPYFIPYLVGAIAVWNSATSQRLGDRWAKTVVVTKASMLARGSVTYGPGAPGAWQSTPAPPQTPPLDGTPPLPPPPPARP
jgi:uncharacterized RDD family membrane protein YckC